jgi:hypothetical protein
MRPAAPQPGAGHFLELRIQVLPQGIDRNAAIRCFIHVRPHHAEIWPGTPRSRIDHRKRLRFLKKKKQKPIIFSQLGEAKSIAKHRPVAPKK